MKNSEAKSEWHVNKDKKKKQKYPKNIFKDPPLCCIVNIFICLIIGLT